MKTSGRSGAQLLAAQKTSADAGAKRVAKKGAKIVTKRATKPAVKTVTKSIASSPAKGFAKPFAKAASSRPAPGVVTGLALTAANGRGATAATVECLPLPGRGKLILTGNLVGSARDAAHVAVSLARARAEALGLDPAQFLRLDIHFHVMDPLPQKGGPSIGLPMFVALVSALTKKPIDKTLAFTGELSLTGAVLPVEGLAAKVKAAARAGCARVIAPAANVEELRPGAAGAPELEAVTHVNDVLKNAWRKRPA